jgi:aryl-alcohol dehydrogenase-like predicted oxidoreductase
VLPHRSIGALAEVSVVGLGCNNFGRRLGLEETRAVVDAALDCGVCFLDTADVYGRDGASERLLGEVLVGRRERVVLATKFGGKTNGSAAVIRKSIDASLERLRTDRIDLYQYHQPDGVTPIAETLGALGELVAAGKVREIGCSNFSAEQLREAAEGARSNGLRPFASVQNEYSLLEREIEREVLSEAERLGMAVIPYFPLADGLLTGKYRRGEDPPPGTRLVDCPRQPDDAVFDRLEPFAEFAAERGVEPVEVAIGWLAAQPAVASVIAGATKPEQVRANARGAEWRPSETDLAELDAIFPRGSTTAPASP